MAKTTAPLLSFGASGAIAKTQVYSKWKGIPYVRRYTVPSNPNTTAQQEVRDTFRWLNGVWRFMPAAAVTAYDLIASTQARTARNAFISENLANLLNESDLTNFNFSPAVRNGPVAAGMVLTPGANQINVVLTAPSVPSGWTVTQAIAACIRDQDPQSGTLYEVTADVDASDPYSIDLTGLTSSVLYSVGGWFEYARPDGSQAFGVSLMDTDTPT